MVNIVLMIIIKVKLDNMIDMEVVTTLEGNKGCDAFLIISNKLLYNR